MHLQGLAGLLILGLMRCIDADLATGSPPLVSDFNDEGDDTGDRVGLSAVDKLKKLFSSSTVSSQQPWLDKGKSADTVFARMRLTDAGEGCCSVPNSLSGSSMPKS
ncbi:hypothetical protein PF008_g27603 [Phytophthora fragariae]|uniref:RxLR effector protein n=1 Tax=Phytophthora fragariae TaxID=53985 RepID=A0A6G0QDQ9_9STRA|nr:hypothetical protein PF008_g27603 [Phytophthora fragariae]